LYFLIKNLLACLFHTPQQVDGTHAIKEAHETFPGSQISPSIILLDAQPCPLPHTAARIDISWLEQSWLKQRRV